MGELRCVVMVVVVVVVGCLMATGVDSRPLSSSESSRMDRFMHEIKRCGRVPAMSLSMVRDGEVVYVHGYGTANPTARTATTRDTVFCLGGITQTFTATLMAKLLNDNRNYTWDTPITEMLGGLVQFGDRYRSEYLSLKDVFTMRTGLTNMDIVPLANSMRRYRLIRNLKFAPEVAPFRERFVHNDVMFVLAGEVLRVLGRDSFDKLVKRHLLEPLGMTNTFFLNVDAEGQANLAQPVLSYKGSPMVIPMESLRGQHLIAAGTSMCSSALDMANWLLFNLDDGMNSDQEEIIPSHLLAELYTPQTVRSGGGDPRTEGFTQHQSQIGYTLNSNTLGYERGFFRDYTMLSKGGSLPGYESLLTFIPERDVGVFTGFVGDNNARLYATKTFVNSYALDMLLHGQPGVDLDDVCNVIDNMVDEVNKYRDSESTSVVHQAGEAQRPLETYRGLYRSLAFDDVRVVVNESMLYLSYGMYAEYILHPTDTNDVFIMEAISGPIWYTTHVDIYRQTGRFVARFNASAENSDVIETVVIPHFDKNVDPVFGKRVEIPDLSAKPWDDCNGSPVATTTFTLVYLLSFIIISLKCHFA
ncbi:beta-lactamase-like [Gigantopelta aegis]|uniref:beta-lactamase-like n=1 Tax=Gigantopelta aegis TaxID=1735272 RepID=UPI001B88B105|nr:beta-lactamase-like [Gigantopelta aegis]